MQVFKLVKKIIPLKIFTVFLLMGVCTYTFSLEYTFCLKSQDNKVKIKFTIIDIDYRYGFIQYNESYDARLILWKESSLIIDKNNKNLTTHTWVEHEGGVPLDGKYLVTLEDWQGKNIVKSFTSFIKNKEEKYYEHKSFYTKYGCKWSKDERLNLDTHGSL